MVARASHYQAEHAALVAAARARAKLNSACELTPRPPSRAKFITRECDAALLAGLRATETPDGMRIGDRTYVALPCRCVDARCPGWAMVHDDPNARAHFGRLFGCDEA